MRWTTGAERPDLYTRIKRRAQKGGIRIRGFRLERIQVNDEIEAKANTRQVRNAHSGEMLRHYIFQKIYRDMLQNKKKYIS